jgi:phosphoribosyl-ATP pyrophosphohydrolase
MKVENNVVTELYEVILDRRDNPIEQSYTNYLFEKGLDKILKKIGEESSEVIISSKNQDNLEIVKEICDLIYHVMVLMVDKDIKLEDVAAELEERRLKIGNKKPGRKTQLSE